MHNNARITGQLGVHLKLGSHVHGPCARAVSVGGQIMNVNVNLGNRMMNFFVMAPVLFLIETLQCHPSNVRQIKSFDFIWSLRGSVST